jgi:hypothetical protein
LHLVPSRGEPKDPVFEDLTQAEIFNLGRAVSAFTEDQGITVSILEGVVSIRNRRGGVIPLSVLLEYARQMPNTLWPMPLSAAPPSSGRPRR